MKYFAFIFTCFAVAGLCSATVTNDALKRLSQELWDADTNNANGAFQLQKQGRAVFGSSEDKAPGKLFERVSPDIWTSTAVLSALRTLYDNNEPSVTRREVVTDAERAEENKFLNAVMRTNVMQKAYQFLKAEGLAPSTEVDFKRNLRDIWFGIYNRHRDTPSSSGFEHVFLGEVKKGEVSGFHNWLYFMDQEAQGKINYLGWQKSLGLGKSASDLFKNTFTWNGVQKDSSSMFVGTSPEFEVALYTVCFYARPNQRCPLQINGKTFDLKTFREVDANLGKSYIGSAFPQF